MSDAEQRPMSEADFKAMLEDLAAERLFTLLRGRGHLIDEVRWPDRERKGVKGRQRGRGKTVDLMFTQDGRPVSVDVIELHESERHARQHVEMGRIVNDMQLELTPLVRELSPGNTIAISWTLRWLPPSRKVLRLGLEMAKETILAAAPRLRPGEHVELLPKPEFIEELEATCYASKTPTFGFFTMHAEQTGRVNQAAESMAEFLLASSKPGQLQGFDDARVLAVDRAVMPFTEDLRDALAARAGRVPANWTAIYFVVPWREAPPAISEVWRRPTSERHE